MSTYIMSDIHGASERFHALLAEIPIDLTVDVLYINGDIVDRGKDSLRLFFEILEMQKEYGDHLVITKGNQRYELFPDQRRSSVQCAILGFEGARQMHVHRPCSDPTHIYDPGASYRHAARWKGDRD